METFLEEIIPAVTENYEFDYRDKSLILILNFLTIWITMEGSELLTSQSNHPPQMTGFRLGP